MWKGGKKCEFEAVWFREKLSVKKSFFYFFDAKKSFVWFRVTLLEKSFFRVKKSFFSVKKHLSLYFIVRFYRVLDRSQPLRLTSRTGI